MGKRIPILVFVACVVTTNFCFGQANSDESGVKDVIAKLFKGMELGDSAMVHAAFYKIRSTTATVMTDRNGKLILDTDESIQGFLDAVGKPHKEVWHEEIWDLKVQVDGNFAQAWCDYAFYADKTFSHCGVDAFQLIKSSDGWKIFHLADTRRRTGCAVPKEIEAKYK